MPILIIYIPQLFYFPLVYLHHDVMLPNPNHFDELHILIGICAYAGSDDRNNVKNFPFLVVRFASGEKPDWVLSDMNILNKSMCDIFHSIWQLCMRAVYTA